MPVRFLWDPQVRLVPLGLLVRLDFQVSKEAVVPLATLVPLGLVFLLAELLVSSLARQALETLRRGGWTLLPEPPPPTRPQRGSGFTPAHNGRLETST